MLYYCLLIIFPALMAYSAASDLVTMTIPNAVSLILVGVFVVVAFMSDMPLYEIGSHLLAGLVVLVVTFTLFSMGAIGGGDAKLAAATSIWMGFSHVAGYILLSTLIGGGLTLLMLSLRRYPWPAILDRYPWIARLYRLDHGIPYGIALGIAGLMTYTSTDLWHRIPL